jgi:hypothetical protein
MQSLRDFGDPINSSLLVPTASYVSVVSKTPPRILQHFPTTIEGLHAATVVMM